MFLKLKKVIAITAAIVFIVTSFVHGILANTYVNYPRYPNPGAGKIVPYVVKGIIVYITQVQQNFLTWLMWIEIASGIVAALVILIHGGDPFKPKR